MALLVTCWVIVFATHLLGAVAAFGSTFLALPFMVWCVDDLDTAVLVLLVVGTVQSYHLFGTTRRAVCGPELTDYWSLNVKSLVPIYLRPVSQHSSGLWFLVIGRQKSCANLLADIIAT